MKHSRICPCGYRVAGGALCACQQRRQAARPSASARGYGTDWQALRASTPRTPCTGCARPWKSGFHLDHIKARNAGGTDNASNLHWLCHSCHSRKTAKKDGGFGHPRTPANFAYRAARPHGSEVRYFAELEILGSQRTGLDKKRLVSLCGLANSIG
jgi:5-methylcytosine-specific restriction endonuclease McrA